MNLKNCTIEKVETRKDRTFKITIGTNELTPDQMAELMLSCNNEVLAVELPTEHAEGKSQSKRLKDVFYVTWKQGCEKDKEFNEKFETSELHYAHMMEKVINFYKKQLT